MREFYAQLDNLHTTKQQAMLIKQNLQLDNEIDPVEYCMTRIKDIKSRFAEIDEIMIITNAKDIFVVNINDLSIIDAQKFEDNIEKKKIFAKYTEV